MRRTSTAYRGVLVNTMPRRWHAVVMQRWPRDSAIVEWHQRAGRETGLGGYAGTGYGTRTELYRAIDQAIARVGPPPTAPVLPELDAA